MAKRSSVIGRRNEDHANAKKFFGNLTKPMAILGHEGAQALPGQEKNYRSKAWALDQLVSRGQGKPAETRAGKTNENATYERSNGRTFERTYTTGPKAGTTETVKKK